MLPFTTQSQVTRFESIGRKGENSCNEHFLLFSCCFLPLQRLTLLCEPESVCASKRVFKFGRSKTLHFGKSLFTERQSKVLDHSNLKYFADDKINVTYKINFVIGRVENIVSKGENADFQHFLFYTQCFQKTSFSGSLKVGIMW